MAVNIKLKHSSIQDKAPVAADLSSAGEVALNLHPDSPALYIKDSNGDIVKLAGAGSVTDEASVKKVGDNMTGDLTLGAVGTPVNTIEASGNVTLGEANSATIALGFATGTTAQTIQIGTASAGPAVTVNSAGQGGGGATQNVMLLDTPLNIGTSALTPEVSITPAGEASFLGDVTVGTDKITLDAADGHARFGGDVRIHAPDNEFPLLRLEKGTLGVAQFTSTADALAIFSETGSGNQIKLQAFPGEDLVTLKYNAAVGVTNDVFIAANITKRTQAGASVCLVSDDDTRWFNSPVSLDDWTIKLDNTTGAATFAGAVSAPYFASNGGTVGYYHTNPVTNKVTMSVENNSLGIGDDITVGAAGTTSAIALNTTGSASFGGGITKIFDTYGITLDSPSNAGNNAVIAINNNGSRVIDLKADGSSTFKGAVNADTSAINSFAFAGTNSSSPTAFGTIYARNNGADGSPCYQATDSNGEVKARINNDGTATFVSVNGASIFIQTEADDDTKYDVTTEEYTETETYTVEVPVIRPEGVVGTADLVDEPKTRTITKEREVTKTHEVRTYNGAVLDVKDELQSLRSRATQQDETIKLMTAALKSLGIDTASFPSPEDEEPTTKSRKNK